MSTQKIIFNGEQVPFTILIAGTQGNPNIHIDYDTSPGWPQSVIVSGIEDLAVWNEKMLEAFTQCGADTTKITYETI